VSDLGPAPEGTIANRVFVLVLQHPQERREPRSTAATAVAALRHARLIAGLSWPNLARVLGRRADPARWGVLYLGSARPEAFPAASQGQREVYILGRDNVPIDDPAPILARLEGIVLLDGTWSQAKTLWWRNPWLLKLHRLALNPPHPSRLGRLRREPRREALSTLEAITLVLRRLEPAADATDRLLAALDRIIAEQRPLAQPAASA